VLAATPLTPKDVVALNSSFTLPLVLGRAASLKLKDCHFPGLIDERIVGVSARAILNAIKNPTRVDRGVKWGNGLLREDARVVVRSDGNVISANPLGSAGLRGGP
jgi:hypothetical protein